jgi:hypothetical protein
MLPHGCKNRAFSVTLSDSEGSQDFFLNHDNKFPTKHPAGKIP